MTNATRKTRQDEMQTIMILTMELDSLGRQIRATSHETHPESVKDLISRHIEINAQRISLMGRLGLIPAGN